jgi:pullulanase/glycogen debranching enzyme
VSVPVTGAISPLGATNVQGGVNFSLYSRDATCVGLLLFDRPDDSRPARMITLDPASNRTYHYWHVFVPDSHPGQIYGFRAHGPFDPATGVRFDPTKRHGVKLGQPDWGHSSHSIALSAELKREGILFHLILNAYWEPLEFELPAVGEGGANPWRRWIDTALDSPEDIVPWQTAPSLSGYSYRAEPRSLVILLARNPGTGS